VQVEQRLQRGVRVFLRSGCHRAVAQRLEQRQLAAEVVVDPEPADPGGGADVVHVDGVEAAVGEQPRRSARPPAAAL
jgi:hypothetical protein